MFAVSDDLADRVMQYIKHVKDPNLPKPEFSEEEDPILQYSLAVFAQRDPKFADDLSWYNLLKATDPEPEPEPVKTYRTYKPVDPNFVMPEREEKPLSFPLARVGLVALGGLAAVGAFIVHPVAGIAAAAAVIKGAQHMP